MAALSWAPEAPSLRTNGSGLTGLRRRATPPRGPRRPIVSSYRAFASSVFVAVVAVVLWGDRTSWATPLGLGGVALWVLTVIGHFELGPVHRLWRAWASRRPAALRPPR